MDRADSSYAIITGASSGLGRALAEGLAARGHNLLITALPETGLPGCSATLAEKYKIKVLFLETDLLRSEAPQEILDYVKRAGISIDILVNNVGIGYGGGIGGYSEREIEESIFLNMRCATLMTNIFIDELKAGGRAYILNIGSFGGFLPMPHKSIYTATKSYIYHFTLAIREELRGTGVSVSVAMPGPILTNSKVRKRVDQQGFVARSNVLEADKAAACMIEKMFRGRPVIIPRWTIRIAYSVAALLPYRILMIVLGRLFKGVD